MNFIPETLPLIPNGEGIQEPKKRIQLQIYSEPVSPALIVNKLGSIEGPVDIYCWYEGSQCLPKSGADFMKKFIFEPLYQLKKDAKIFLYSLKAWDFKKNIAAMPVSTPLGEAINRINKAAIECIYSASFFQYCIKVQEESRINKFLNEELPKKKGLFILSENQKTKEMTIAQLFNERASLFDSIKNLDVAVAYSLMQYVEGYYLIQKSIKRGLLNNQAKIQMAFVLPNDESKYYLDYPKDIEKMLQLDFGRDLAGMDIHISFQFFEYGASLTDRPYTDKQRKALKAEAKDIESYFDYLSQSSCSKQQLTRLFLRDVIHNINGWY